MVALLAAVTTRCGMGVPEMAMSRIRSVIGDRFELTPDAVAAGSEVRIRIQHQVRAVADPDDLDQLAPARSSRNITVPLIVEPSVGGPGSIAEASIVPGFAPLHDQVILGVGRVTPDRSVQGPIDSIRGTGEDPSPVVVAELVEPAGVGRSGGEDRKDRDEQDRQELLHDLLQLISERLYQIIKSVACLIWVGRI